MKLLLASPTYGPSSPICQKSLRVAMITAAKAGVDWVDDISYDRCTWVGTRNLSLKAAYKYKGVDGIMWIDDDMLFPFDGIYRLLEHGKDLVEALCFERKPPYLPGMYNVKDGKLEPILEWPENELLAVDRIGFGMVYTSMKLIHAVHALPECREVGPFGGLPNWAGGEDHLFAERAQRAGFQPYVDTGVRPGHLGAEVFIDEGTYRRENGLYRASPTLPPDTGSCNAA